jgi:hypothetical protein
MENYHKLQELVAATSEDAVKSDNGNKAAGRRLRKKLGEMKTLIKAIRIESLVEKIA